MRSLLLLLVLTSFPACSGGDFGGSARSPFAASVPSGQGPTTDAKATAAPVTAATPGEGGHSSTDVRGVPGATVGGGTASLPSNGMLATTGDLSAPNGVIGGSQQAVLGLNPALVSGDTGSLIPCPPSNEVILVLDFKSGWWSGDGGDFVDKITSSLALPCHGRVSLEYHHIILPPLVVSWTGVSKQNGVTNNQLLVPSSPHLSAGSGTFAAAFRDPTWASYTQIWLLSGSSADPEDLPTNDPFFQQVLTHLKNGKANYLIGAGYGSVSHANAALQTLGLGTSIATAQVEGSILDATTGVQLTSSISGGQLLAPGHLLFSNGVTHIADAVTVGGVVAHGDRIVPGAGVTPLAQDNLNQLTLAVATSGSAKVVIDSDMPRYYAGWSSQSDSTVQLLRNMVVYLSH